MTRTRAGVLLALVAMIGGLVWFALARGSDPHAEFRAAVADAPGCTRDDQCTVLWTPCPLGCAHAVSVDGLEELSLLADRLAARARALRGECAQDCLQAPPAICEAKRCAFSN